jgi:hypothetical protein
MEGKENVRRDLDFFVLLEWDNCFSPGQKEGRVIRLT